MEVALDLNMEVKEEPVILKDEPLTVKDESLSVKEEIKLESEPQPNLFWQPHAAASLMKESNDSKAVTAAKKAWAANIGFLQDCTIRLLCVFALDRFGDYVSDQVVAPVRETCAQVMGAVMKQMPPALVHESLNIMLQMQSRSEWEVRHGSLLGIKYLVAVRQEMLQELLPRVLPACMAGLEDPDDDVRAVAAEALTPAAASIVASAGSKNVRAILLSLWDILLDLDDLSPSTSSVMHLLSELYSQPQVDSQTVVEKPLLLDLNETMMDDHSLGDAAAGAEDDAFMLSTLAPRLWPFMRHNITSVRLAAVRTLV
jgi:TATA-binding protein-associated factor